jgi:hypothetical protein
MRQSFTVSSLQEAPRPARRLRWEDHFRAARQLFIISFNLHARHFTRPTWTNAVQVKFFGKRHAFLRTQQVVGGDCQAQKDVPKAGF